MSEYSFLTAHQHIITLLVPYDAEGDAIKEWKYSHPHEAPAAVRKWITDSTQSQEK